MSALLEVTDLRVTLQTARGRLAALRGVSFALERGDTLGLIGESGCGKSITALALMGLLPDGAQVARHRSASTARSWSALDDAAMCALRGDRIGMVFQEPMTALNPLHTIGRQIAEPLRLHQRPERARRRAPRRCACSSACSCPRPRERLDAYPHQLSGGQRQRVVDRHRAGLRARPADRRRADHRARRDDPARGARPDRRAGGRERHGAAADQPRPGRDGRARRSACW